MVAFSPVVASARVPASVASVASLVRSFSVVGFTGSRSGFSGRGELAFLSLAPLLVCSPCSVVVGCARGVDQAVRSAFPGARVFSVSSFTRAGFGLSRACFARRSAALVRSVAPAGVLVGFPSGGCPAGLFPSALSSACFAGFGSGSWSSLAFAVGLGGQAVVWLPSGVQAPLWLCCSLGGGWFSAR